MNMKILFAAALFVAGSLGACDNTTSTDKTGTNSSGGTTTKTPSGMNSSSSTGTSGSSSSTGTNSSSSSSSMPGKGGTAPENTGLNKRDRDGTTKTPMDQGNNKSDVDITAAIRRSVTSDKSMSVNAQNCKIITEKGMVTLRGVVDTQSERDAIDAYAKATTGVSTVDNQLEVKRGSTNGNPNSPSSPGTPSNPGMPSTNPSNPGTTPSNPSTTPSNPSTPGSTPGSTPSTPSTPGSTPR